MGNDVGQVILHLEIVDAHIFLNSTDDLSDL